MSERAQFQRLAELAQERSDAAGRRLGRSLELLAASRSRQTLLERYRDEYRGRLAASGAQGMAPGELRNFRAFLARLEQAIAQQRAEVEMLERGVGESRELWLAERRREQSFDVLADRAELAARGLEARRLQKMLDELCGRSAGATSSLSK